jgi:cobalt/nickel transport system permease protein
VQALVFADGGLTAIGLNIFNNGSSCHIGSLVHISDFYKKYFQKIELGFCQLPLLAAYLSVPISAIGFTLQFALGGTAAITLDKVMIAMVGVHSVIGIGEAIITVLTISAVLSVRKDLVYGASNSKVSLVK